MIQLIMDLVIYVDSKNRDSNLYPSGNSYVLHLTNPIKDVTQVDLVAAEFPNTFYNLLNGSNCITFGSTSINLNPGFYTAGNLVTEINARLPTTQTFQGTTYQTANVTWLSTQGKFLFVSNTAFTLSISNSISKLIGLNSGTYTANTIASDNVLSQVYTSGYFIKSDVIADLSTNEFVFLDVEELRTPTTASALAMKPDGSGTYSGTNARNSFAMIPVTVNSGTVRSFTEGADYAIHVEYPHPIDVISRFTIKWVDSSGQLVNFNGMNNNAFVLRFHTKKVEPPPPPPEIDRVELRRILDDMITVQKPQQVEEKRPIVGRWTLVIFILIALIGYIIYKRIQPVAVTPLPLKRV